MGGGGGVDSSRSLDRQQFLPLSNSLAILFLIKISQQIPLLSSSNQTSKEGYLPVFIYSHQGQSHAT